MKIYCISFLLIVSTGVHSCSRSKHIKWKSTHLYQVSRDTTYRHLDVNDSIYICLSIGSERDSVQNPHFIPEYTLFNELYFLEKKGQIFPRLGKVIYESEDLLSFTTLVLDTSFARVNENEALDYLDLIDNADLLQKSHSRITTINKAQDYYTHIDLRRLKPGEEWKQASGQRP